MSEILGLNEVMKNLNKAIGKIKGATLAGFLEGARIIREDMERVPPKIPVDTGNLRASWFVTSGRGPMRKWRGNFKGKKAGKMAEWHGNMIAEYTGRAKAERNPTVFLGFSANYAFFVHEGYGKHFQRPGSGAGFFAKAIDRNRERIIEEVRKRAKV